MLLRYFFDRALAQASYLIGSQATGEALVVDPSRDITGYVAAAAQEGLRITHVAETHIHADFVSGVRELAAKTGARMALSVMGGEDWIYNFFDNESIRLHDGDHFMVGDIRVEAIHTPGHSPEHLIFQITDTKQTNVPMALLTGDCLFVGDVGRPDLLETAVGSATTSTKDARAQFANVQRLKGMPDHLLVLPGHGAGSLCGKLLGANPTSTLGYEKQVNPAFQFSDESAFVAWLLSDQPEIPPYFGHIKRINRDGAPLLDTLPELQPMEGFILPEVEKEGALVIDARADGEWIPGTIKIVPTRNKFATYASWFVDPTCPTYLVAEPEDLPRLVRDLHAIGVDNLPGYFPPYEVVSKEILILTLSPEEAAARIASGLRLLDVRAKSEFDAGTIAGATLIHYGELSRHLDSIPKDVQVIVYCASGPRSIIAHSLLRKQGYSDVYVIQGGFDAWQAAGLPVEG